MIWTKIFWLGYILCMQNRLFSDPDDYVSWNAISNGPNGILNYVISPEKSLQMI